MTGTDLGRLDEVARWIEIDPDPETAAELAGLLDRDPVMAAELFEGRIAFGTAGLRSALGPGPRRMNRLVVRQTTEGLMRWLPTGARVVIGYDARHKSAEFARDAALVVAAAGGFAELLNEPTPTPVLAYAVLDRSMDAGIMITASHNPATDNGYKLYLDDGIQLVSPADAEIASLIDEVAKEQEVGPGALDLEADWSARITVLDDTPQRRHREAAIGVLMTDRTRVPRNVSVVYTALHGVGGQHLLSCFEEAGFQAPTPVVEQFEPDPDFPTAAFPNPEEDGALDLAFARADELDPSPDLILANDPDADRLAVAVQTDRNGDGVATWQRLTGDQVGALLLDHILSHRLPSGAERRSVVASSIVSSQLINAMAAAADARGEGRVSSERTLTGFKWVARPIVDQPEATYLFGYEEALGYCIGDAVRDKDGISAALVMAELAAECRAQGTTVAERLEDIAARFGLYATDQVTFSFVGMAVDAAEELKTRAMGIRPDELAGMAVQRIEDLSLGATLPPTPGLIIELAGRARVLIRPSGTEPKLKVYLEVVETTDGGVDIDLARQRAQHKLALLAESVRAHIDR